MLYSIISPLQRNILGMHSLLLSSLAVRVVVAAVLLAVVWALFGWAV